MLAVFHTSVPPPPPSAVQFMVISAPVPRSLGLMGFCFVLFCFFSKLETGDDFLDVQRFVWFGVRVFAFLLLFLSLFGGWLDFELRVLCKLRPGSTIKLDFWVVWGFN